MYRALADGGYDAARKAVTSMESGRRHRAGQDVRSARTRRCRFPDGNEMGLRSEGRLSEVHRGQSRRGRARHVQGPRAGRDGSPPVARGDHHRRVGEQGRESVHLLPRRVRPRLPATRRGNSGCLQPRVPRAGASSGRASISTSFFTAAPARTSAARSRRCSTHSRVTEGSRDCAHRFPQ